MHNPPPIQNKPKSRIINEVSKRGLVNERAKRSRISSQLYVFTKHGQLEIAKVARLLLLLLSIQPVHSLKGGSIIDRGASRCDKAGAIL